MNGSPGVLEAGAGKIASWDPILLLGKILLLLNIKLLGEILSHTSNDYLNLNVEC